MIARFARWHRLHAWHAEALAPGVYVVRHKITGRMYVTT